MSERAKKYISLGKKIQARRAAEYRLMKDRIDLEFKQRSLLDKCKRCRGNGRYSEEDYRGCLESYQCDECHGRGYFMPQEIKLALEKQELQAKLDRLKKEERAKT